MITIDLNRIKTALPDRAKVTIGKTKKGSPFIECIVRFPSLDDKGTNEGERIIQEVFNWQREIIGRENISEFYTEETGSHWFVYLKKQPLEFLNTTDEDINNWTKLNLVTDGKLNPTLK